MNNDTVTIETDFVPMAVTFEESSEEFEDRIVALVEDRMRVVTPAAVVALRD